MPSTPYAKLLISVNGGAPSPGPITADPGDTIQFTAESTAHWDLTTPPRWEIHAYPPGWTGPASGWTTESVPQPGGGTADVYVYLGLGPPPAFLLPALPMWGKFLPRLTVQGGLLNGLPSAQLVDNTAGVQTIGPNGLYDVAVGEEGQFDNARSWVGPLQDDLRLLDAALAGAAAPYTSTPTAIEPSAGSAGAINQYARGDHAHPVTFGTPTTITVGAAAAAGGGTTLAGAAHVHALPAPSAVAGVSAAVGIVGSSSAVAREDHAHQVAVGNVVAVGTSNNNGASNSLARADHVHALWFATVNSVLATANAPVAINGQTFTSGGNIAPYFSTSEPNPAESGLLRADAIREIVKARDDGGSNDINLVTWGVESTDVAAFGSPANSGTAVQAGNSAWGLSLDVGGVNVARLSQNVFGLFTTSGLEAGGGDRVIQLQNATVDSTTADSGCVNLWSSTTGSFRGITRSGPLTVLTTNLDATVDLDDVLRAPDRKTTRVTTTDATNTTVFTYPLGSKSVVDFTATAEAYAADGSNGARLKVTGGAMRGNGGAATLLGTNDTSAKSTVGAAAWLLRVTAVGNDLEVTVQGAGATTIQWFIQFDVNYMGLP